MCRSPVFLFWWWERSTTDYFVVFNLEPNHELIPDSSISRLTLTLAALPPRSRDPHGSHFNFYHPDWIWGADPHWVHQIQVVLLPPLRPDICSWTLTVVFSVWFSLIETHRSGSGFISFSLSDLRCSFLDSLVWTGQNDAVTWNWKYSQSDTWNQSSGVTSADHFDVLLDQQSWAAASQQFRPMISAGILTRSNWIPEFCDWSNWSEWCSRGLE